MSKFVSRKLLAYVIGVLLVIITAFIPFTFQLHQLVIGAIQAMAVTYLGSQGVVDAVTTGINRFKGDESCEA